MVETIALLILLGIAVETVLQANGMSRKTCLMRRWCLKLVIVGASAMACTIHYHLTDYVVLSAVPMLAGVFLRLLCDSGCFVSRVKGLLKISHG